ncbi:MAG: DmsC/YnfH family molybdoenzyme membrane anchor subunit [Bacteroidota bacterium]|nr:DmsC/YnfH family molybdoenzyme membrane anchor subunit [Bacteroidota bacterium]
MRGFIFDTNKCVACHACVVACSVENDLHAPYHWRDIDVYNEFSHPDLAVFNLSLACNHCEDAECIPACPANAFYRDQNSGAVLVNQDLCIGCKYCTWACPFDAPIFNNELSVINKCNLCYSRVNGGDVPACAKNCPTAALTFGEFNSDTQEEIAKGFPETKLKPGIRFVENRSARKPDTHLSSISDNPKQIKFLNEPNRKVHLKNEWTLLLFTLMLPLLTAGLAGILAGYLFINPFLFGFIATVSLLVSALHLGKPFRAVYAMRNISTSWLSREIFSYGLFYSSTLTYLILFPQFQCLGIVAIIFGLICLFIVDRVYKYFEDGSGIRIQSSWVFFTGLLWISLILQEPLPLFFVIFLKLVLYLFRKIKLWSGLRLRQKIYSFLRVISLLITPVLYALDVALIELFYPLFIGEVIDRLEFYSENYIQSPSRQVYEELRTELERFV